MGSKRQQKKRDHLRTARAQAGDRSARTGSATNPNRLLQDTGRQAQRSAASVLQRPNRQYNVEHLAHSALSLALEVIQQSPSAGRHECKPGCCFCCHTAVTVAPPEAFAIANYLQEHNSNGDLKALRRRLDENAALASSISREEYIARLVPCALLTEDGNCLAHPVRPLACAGFLSTSRDKCEAEFNRTPGRDAVPTDKFATAAGSCVAIGLRDACQGAKVEATSYELHHALRLVLDQPDAAQRWARGERVFSKCPT